MRPILRGAGVVGWRPRRRGRSAGLRSRPASPRSADHLRAVLSASLRVCPARDAAWFLGYGPVA